MAAMGDSRQLDEGTVRELHDQAKAMSDSVTHLMGGLQAQLQAISRITLQGAQIYQTSVENTQAVVDKCIKDTLLLISKADELNNDMEAIHKLGDQIREVKRVLDELEAVCK